VIVSGLDAITLSVIQAALQQTCDSDGNIIIEIGA